MDSVTAFIVAHKIPIGRELNLGMNAVKDGSGSFFDLVSDALGGLIDHTSATLGLVPPLVFCAILAVLAYLIRRSWRVALFAFAALVFILNQGYWADTLVTLVITFYATLASMLVGVPIGIAAGHREWLAKALRPLLDLMQTLPTFVYLIPMLSLFGLGVVPGIIATVIFAIPAPIRMTQLGIASVPLPLREAGQAFGATGAQLLRKVELPHAGPSIMEGLTQTIMLSLSMSVIATMVGSGGLGVPVLRSLNQVKPAMGFEAGLAIVLVAILLDRTFRRPSGTMRPA
ncbi:ABC transporter permease subunit [Lichenihabitans sp. Uapishka_5]|uniref:ABC transporter permease subunit n=1 Tax=Lichenihabitans sp. Uapishka_5 TaxID=3037302 RepID=UPI0029E7F028|nr:ABC transporter permease subunit [Lichenihabitans sp. Uapishka_5]MDX7949917.1 ABC transporter permease subunit [Lichenihabitans sp. Uapishka_5]